MDSPRVGLAEAFTGDRGRDLGYVRDFAVTTENLGFDSLWVPEHVVFFPEYKSRYPYNEDGILRLGPTPGVYDPFQVLLAASLVATRILVGTSILLIGERNPLVTAREVATLDQLTGGRFLLGIGVGWSREEYEALGVPWERRGDRCDEYVMAMKALWTEERSTFQGEFVAFEEALAYPKPAQSPHPPVLVGGNTPAALRRAARLGEGWFGWNLRIDELAMTVAALDKEIAARGRSREAMTIQVGLPHGGTAEEAAGYVEECGHLGLDRVVLGLPTSPRNFQQRLEEIAAELP